MTELTTMFLPQVLHLLLGLSILESFPRLHDVHEESLVRYGVGFLDFDVGEGELSSRTDDETKHETKGELELERRRSRRGKEGENERDTELWIEAL